MTALEINDLTAKVEQSGKNEISTFYPSKINELKALTQKVEVERGRDTPKKSNFLTTTMTETPEICLDNQSHTITEEHEVNSLDGESLSRRVTGESTGESFDSEVYRRRFQDRSYNTRYGVEITLKTFQEYLLHTQKEALQLTEKDTEPFLKHSFESLYQSLQSLAEGTYWRVLRTLKTYLLWLWIKSGNVASLFLQITEKEASSHYKEFFKSKQEEHRKRYYNQEEILRAYKKHLFRQHREYGIIREKESRLQKFIRNLDTAGLTLYTVEEVFVNSWQKELLQNGEYSADYQAKLLRAVKLFFDWFCKQGYRKEHPFPKYKFREYKKEILPLCLSRNARKNRFAQVPERFRKYFDAANIYEESLCLEIKTRHTHKVGWEFFFKYLEKEQILQIEEVDELILEKYLLFLADYRNEEGNPLSLNVRCRYIIALKRLFGYLSRFRHIPRDPACSLELPKNPRGLPTSGIKDREVQLLLESASTENPFGLRDRAILESLYSTGLRNKELRSVKVQDLDFEMGLLRVNTPKGGALYQRVIAIGKTALYWVQRYLRESRPMLLLKKDKEYLFLNKDGGQISGSALLNVVKNALLRARIKNPRIVTHSFRVACATGMLKGKGQSLRGADIKWVQEQLGHTSIQSTSKYLRLVPGELKRIHTLHHPRENVRSMKMGMENGDKEMENGETFLKKSLSKPLQKTFVIPNQRVTSRKVLPETSPTNL